MNRNISSLARQPALEGGATFTAHYGIFTIRRIKYHLHPALAISQQFLDAL
jgi:hypothetical protein